ncbi:MAG TPA: FHA domain-containing protein, partial [Ktedonobacteraceae bacterium]|nr:FHA domain-containing protein [Ktedonobacteraceae bacterium]
MIMNDGNTPPGLISIRFLSGPLAGQTFPIRKPSVTIGRGEINDIVVRSDQKVSRSHARLRWNGSSWSIEKLASQNILSVNQQQVEQATISNNTTIGLGADTSFLFLIEPEVAAAPSSPAQTIPASFQPPSQPTPPLYLAQIQQRS